MSLFLWIMAGGGLRQDKQSRAALRKEVLSARDNMEPGERHRRSLSAMENLCSLPDFRDADVVFLYVSFRSEVETIPLIEHCLRMGKQVVVPLVAEKSQLLPYRIVSKEHDLAPGAFGILEPVADRCQLVDPRTLQVVLVPGSVFDEHGGRFGYGGGYYDRFLVDMAPQARRIGLAFDLQVVGAIPLAPHDQQLDALVTESRVLDFSRHKRQD